MAAAMVRIKIQIMKKATRSIKIMKKATRSFCLWSQLPSDLLQLIFERLSIPDRVRCRSVCTSWNAIPLPPPPPHDIPWLLLSKSRRSKRRRRVTAAENNLRGSSLRFYSILEGRMYTMGGHTHISQVASECSWIVSCSPDGWLFYVDYSCELRCVHLPTGERVILPSVITLPEIARKRTKSGRLRGCYSDAIILFPSDTQVTEMSSCWHQKPRSAANGDGRFLVVAICRRKGIVVLAREGDTSWTRMDAFDHLPRYPIYDMLLHKGSLYLLHVRGGAGYRIQVAADLTSIGPASLIDRGHLTSACSAAYLVEIEGQLWQVERNIFVGDERTRDFQVYKLDESSSSWVAKKSIGDYAIFIGNNQPVAVPVQQYSQLARDCIYFTDDRNTTKFWDAGVYNLRDKSLGPSSIRVTWPQQTWVMPFLLAPKLS